MKMVQVIGAIIKNAYLKLVRVVVRVVENSRSYKVRLGKIMLIN